MRMNKPIGTTSSSVALILTLVSAGPALSLDCTVGSNNTTPVIYPGTTGDDTENGCSVDDQLMGLTGRDNLDGRGGDDLVDGGDDNDLVYGGLGNDAVNGGNHNDGVYGGPGNDVMSGGDGNDFLRANEDSDVLDGGLNDDYLQGGAGIDTYTDAGGFDRISFFERSATQAVVASLDSAGKAIIVNDGFGNAETSSGGVFEGLGDGTVFADKLTGNSSDNLLMGGLGDTLKSGQGNDRFQIDDAPALINGGPGTDTITLFSQFRLVPGSPVATIQTTSNGVEVDLSLSKIIHDGWNAIGSGTGAVTSIENLGGSYGNDKLTGNGYANEIKGYPGDDTIDGKGGKDKIDGGKGVDKMTGGPNSDVFIFHAGDSPLGTPDEITDFRGGAGRDVIDISSVDGNPTMPLPLLTSLGASPGYMIASAGPSQVRILIDTDGDSTANEEILVTFTAPIVPSSNIVP